MIPDLAWQMRIDGHAGPQTDLQTLSLLIYGSFGEMQGVQD